MSQKDTLHHLVDTLPDSAIAAAEHYLAGLQTDPMLRVLLAAPLDDEPTMPEEDEGAALAHDEIQRGEFLTAEEAKRALLG